MLRVLLVDDHPLVRHGIRQILETRLHATVGEADGADGARQAIARGRWDLVVLDISMPGTSGLELISELHATWPALPVLVLSMHPAAQFARRAIGAGALGYLAKDAPPDELVEAIKRTRHGRPFVTESSRIALNSPSRSHDALSDREFQVLRRIGVGRTVSEVAAEIGISVKTVSTYRARLLVKLGLTTNAELMRYAMKEGIAE